ncbi:unnamed protein product, partial [Coregonus sp. 'balchen']
MSCYGTLGGTVYLQLMTAHDITFKKDSNGSSTRIFKMTDNKVIIDDPFKARSHFFINNGTRLQLFIEAPVSPAKLSSECLSNGEMRVSCFSEGDGPQYSWTMDGHPLRDTEASPGDKTNTITLKKGLSEDLNSTVKNNINVVTTSERISHCPVAWGYGPEKHDLRFAVDCTLGKFPLFPSCIRLEGTLPVKGGTKSSLRFSFVRGKGTPQYSSLIVIDIVSDNKLLLLELVAMEPLLGSARLDG